MGCKIKEEVENVCLAEAYVEGKEMYAAGLERNILLRYNLEERKMDRLGWFDGFQFLESSQNAAIYKFENSLFCFSLHSYEVAEYDLQTCSFQYYHPKKAECKPFLICTVCWAGDQVWMFRGVFDGAVMVFSMKTREYSRQSINIEDQAESYKRCNFENSVYIGKKIWRCIPGSSDFMVLDTEKLEAYTVQTNLDLSFFMINGEGRVLYIITSDGRNLVLFDTDSGKTTVYETGYTGMVAWPFTGAAELCGRIFLFPFYENEILCYERREDKLHNIKHLDFPEEFRRIYNVEQRNLFMKWKKTEGALWLLPFAGNGMLRLDADSLSLSYYPIKISKEDYFCEVVKSRRVLSEEEFGLEEYFMNVECGMKEDCRTSVEIGRNIWEAVWADR